MWVAGLPFLPFNHNNHYLLSLICLLSSLLSVHAAMLIHLPPPYCLNRTFLFPVFCQFVSASWSDQSLTILQVRILVFFSCLVGLSLGLGFVVGNDDAKRFGIPLPFLVIWFVNNSKNSIELVGWQSPNCLVSSIFLPLTKLNNSVYFVYRWTAVVLYWTVQFFTACNGNG